MSLRTDLRTTNARLKALGCRCSVLERGELKYLQANLPIKNGVLKKQQRIPLGPVSLQEAEVEGVRLGQMLRSETFAWELWEPEGDELPTGVIKAGEFRVAARRLWEKGRGAQSTWKQKWMPALRKLPEADGVPITEKFLLGIVEGLEPGTAGRKTNGNTLARVAESVGIDGAAIRQAASGYSEKDVKQRNLPSDEEIEAAFELIKAPHWRWAFGCCAAYGLRPHELPDLEFNDEMDALVPDETKTGFRVVWAVHKRWLDQFDLRDVQKPTQRGIALSNAWRKARVRYGIPIPLYDLRHSYAIRCMSKGIPTTVAARLMGHSESIHCRTYRRWLAQSEMQKYKAAFDL